MAHMLCLITPAGMEKMFEEIGKPVAADIFLPPLQIMTEELKRLILQKSIGKRFGSMIWLEYISSITRSNFLQFH